MLNKIKKYWPQIILLILISFLPLGVFAYIEQTAGGSIEAIVTPNNPGPHETVNIKIKGFGFDLPTSNVAWLINNSPQTERRGLAEFSFRTGPIGETISVTAVVETTTGRFIIKNLIFLPAEIDILFETDSYIPAWYRGAALPSSGSNIKIVAQPNAMIKNRQITISELDFTWEQNGRILSSASGLGKNTLMFKLDDTPTTISVTAVMPKTAIKVQKDIVIDPLLPETLLYKTEPLRGVDYSTSLFEQNFLNSDLVSLKAENFYFPLNVIGSLKYIWTLNNKIIETAAPTSEITFAKKDGLDGVSSISVETINPLNTNQNSRASVQFNLNSSF